MTVFTEAKDKLAGAVRTQEARYAGDEERPLPGLRDDNGRVHRRGVPRTTRLARGTLTALSGADLLQFGHAWLEGAAG